MIRYRNRKIREGYSLRRRRFLSENLQDLVCSHFAELTSHQETSDALDATCAYLKSFLANAEGVVKAFARKLNSISEITNVVVSDWKIDSTWEYSCRVSFNIIKGKYDRDDQGFMIANDICNSLDIGDYPDQLWQTAKTFVKFPKGDVMIDFIQNKDELIFTARVDDGKFNREVKF